MSLGGKYVFGTVRCLILPMCILTSCSSVLYVLMALSYVVLDECDDPSPGLCSRYVRKLVYFWCFSFMCEFCFL